MEVINHFSHDHPLVLSEEKRLNGPYCRICREYVLGLCYSCTSCRFYLHKWCAELPRELSSDEHTLVLASISRNPPPTPCDICGDDIPRGFAYSGCSLSLHIQCASFGNDKYYRVTRCYPDDFLTCDICQRSEQLGFLLQYGDPQHPSHRHINCAALPQKVRHANHLHDLVLRPQLPKNPWYFEFICDACEKERDPYSPVYYCEPCDFVAHIGCGVTGSDGVKFNLIGSLPEKQKEEEEVVVKVEKEEEEEEEIIRKDGEKKVTLFTHEHPLNLASSRNCRSLLESTLCRICSYKITFGMIYFCSQCRHFVLHKWCGQLPKQIKSSFHHPDHGPLRLRHPPNLIKRWVWEVDYFRTVFKYCKFCGGLIDGCFYECQECEFLAHNFCALLPNSNHVSHPSHEHALTAVQEKGSGGGGYCNMPLASTKYPVCQACGFLCDYVFLECASCNFHLHIHCFFLPDTGKGKTHRHNFALTYSYQEDPNALEFICDICEKARKPKRWVYCCPDPKCDIVAHIDCAAPKLFTTLEHKDEEVCATVLPIQGTTQSKPEQQQIALQRLILQPAPQLATKVLCLTELVILDELKEEKDYEELLEMVKIDCGEFGMLVNVVIPRSNPSGEPVPGLGKVFLEYADVDGSTKARQGLNGRKFGGNQVVAVFFPEDKFSQGNYDE